MKDTSLYHSLINIMVIIILIISLLLLLWLMTQWHLAFKILLSPVIILAVLFWGHRGVPKLTNDIIEKLFGEKEK